MWRTSISISVAVVCGIAFASACEQAECMADSCLPPGTCSVHAANHTRSYRGEYACLPLHPAGKPCRVRRMADVVLPAVEADNTTTAADIYYCPALNARPLVVLLPGALGDKAWYSGIAKLLASELPAVVLVTQQMRCSPPGCVRGSRPCFCGNTVSTAAVDAVVNWAQHQGSHLPAQEQLAVDSKSVYLIGHSWGAAQVAAVMASKCFPACPPGFVYTPPTAVRAGFAWGFSLINPSTQQFMNGFRNTHGAFVWMNGDGDKTLVRQDVLDGTFSRLAPPKAYAVLSNLDHFSIADHPWQAMPRDGDVESSLDRQEQIAAVSSAIKAWFEAVSLPSGFSGKEASVCSKLRRDDRTASLVVECKEELCQAQE